MRGARFARDNAYSAAPTALKVTIIDVPALPGWANGLADGPPGLDYAIPGTLPGVV